MLFVCLFKFILKMNKYFKKNNSNNKLLIKLIPFFIFSIINIKYFYNNEKVYKILLANIYTY